MLTVRICEYNEDCSNIGIISHSRKGTKFYQKYCKEHWVVKCKPRRRPEDTWVDSNGYVWERHDGGRAVAKHRYVLEKTIGRKLIKGESVHHINGIRDDNRPENLELWVGGIRYGQRATDLRCPHCKRTYQE